MPDKKPDVRIEYPSTGATYYRNEYGVYRYDTYPRHSVLAGQTRRIFLDSFPTLEKAREQFPNASFAKGSGYVPPDLSHLPYDPDYDS